MRDKSAFGIRGKPFELSIFYSKHYIYCFLKSYLINHILAGWLLRYMEMLLVKTGQFAK